ncbi:ABC transporter permease [Aneurinibacillus sp. UBA3580]|jgi:lipopolysaccharide transport system permease protein|uniref:ABC transporter permease n=1 Tax=Aneurinibacillus sp. UBA3580 TaxID=1946041 RepID=UPI0025805E5D|nr:ABC transporter permease [Aneurinibacillus sp. UBA3580]
MNNPFSLLYQYRKILFSITIDDIKMKYAGSMFGGLWILLNPLLFLSAYFLVYISIFKIKLEGISTIDYVLIIFSGLIPWFGFSEAIGMSVNTVTNNSSLIKNTLFPIELIPIKVVLSSVVSQLVGLILLLIVLGIREQLSYHAFLLPFLLILQILFTTGLAWILASLNVFFRDLGQIITVIIILLMLVSPIAYTTDMLTKDLLFFMQFNPMYYMITLYRDIIIYNTFPDVNICSIFIVLSFGFFFIGYYVFTRLKVVFTDYV